MDNFLRDLIKDDYKIFDGLVTLRLVHRTTQEVDFDTGQLNTQRTWEDIEGCLVRQLSERQTGSVRQVFEKGKSITADNYQLVDTTIEVPRKEGRVIEVGDVFEQTLEDGKVKKWAVLSLDFATLDTRHRLGCRIL